jgi:hypothetical protein
MPSEASLLAQIAVNILCALEDLPESCASTSFLKETARRLLQDATAHLSSGAPDSLGVLNKEPECPSEGARVEPGNSTDIPEDNESVASRSRRDFSRWCKALGLPNGHQFFTEEEQSKLSFKLVWGRDSKALLETTCPDGVILRGMSPTGILKAYLKKTAGKESNVDGWKKLSMRSPDGSTLWQIRDHEWRNYTWMSGKFVST